MCYLFIGGFALYIEIGGSTWGELIDLLVLVLKYLWRLEDQLGYTCFFVHCICMSSYFRDHINHLVRVDPLCNLPLGYLIPSPTRSSLVDLP